MSIIWQCSFIIGPKCCDLLDAQYCIMAQAFVFVWDVVVVTHRGKRRRYMRASPRRYTCLHICKSIATVHIALRLESTCHVDRQMI